MGVLASDTQHRSLQPHPRLRAFLSPLPLRDFRVLGRDGSSRTDVCTTAEDSECAARNRSAAHFLADVFLSVVDMISPNQWLVISGS